MFCPRARVELSSEDQQEVVAVAGAQDSHIECRQNTFKNERTFLT